MLGKDELDSQELTNFRGLQHHVIIEVILGEGDRQVSGLVCCQAILLCAEPLGFSLLQRQEHLQILQRVRWRSIPWALALRTRRCTTISLRNVQKFVLR